MKFTIDPEGIGKLLSADEAAAFLTNVGGEVQHEWERLDPRTKPGGHEVPEIQVGPPQIDGGTAMVPVYTNDPIFHIIEFGSVNNAPYRPAMRAALAAGLTFKEQ